MQKIDRFLAIILFLQSKRLVRAQELADYFQVSIRTVYRDINALCEAGVPIASEAGYGYSLVHGYQLPPIMFTEDEAASLMLGTYFVEQTSGDIHWKKNTDSARAKIISVLPEDKKDYLLRLRDFTAVFTSPNANRTPAIADSTISTLHKSIVHRFLLTITYYAYSTEETTERQVEPLAMVYYGGIWHLIAYCRLRNDYRDFRIDRIHSFHTEDTKYAPRPDFVLKDFLKDTFRVDNPHIVTVLFDKSVTRYVSKKHHYGFIEEKILDNGIEMTFLVGSIEWFARWLVSYGNSVLYCEPQELRTKVLQIAGGIVENLSNAISIK